MHGVPKLVAPWMSYVADETVRFMLEYTGVKDLRMRTGFEREGDAHGLEVQGIRTTMTWTTLASSSPEAAACYSSRAFSTWTIRLSRADETRRS